MPNQCPKILGTCRQGETWSETAFALEKVFFRTQFKSKTKLTWAVFCLRKPQLSYVSDIEADELLVNLVSQININLDLTTAHINKKKVKVSRAYHLIVIHRQYWMMIGCYKEEITSRTANTIIYTPTIKEILLNRTLKCTRAKRILYMIKNEATNSK